MINNKILEEEFWSDSIGESKCFYCNKNIQNRSQRYLQVHKRAACEDCVGLEIRAAKIQGISKERVRQLVNKYIEFYTSSNRKEACSSIKDGWRPSSDLNLKGKGNNNDS